VDLIHKLSHRSVNPETDRYTIIKYYYSNPLTIEVLNKGEIIEPAIFKKPHELNTMGSICGANNYFFRNNTVHFVIAADMKC